MDIENNITINISFLLGVDIISTIIKLKIRSNPYINCWAYIMEDNNEDCVFARCVEV